MNKLKGHFFLFVLIQGILYLFLILPWQSPDEPHHFEYVALLTKNIKASPKDYKNVEKKIIESMDRFNAWKYQFIPRPSPLPHKLSDLVFFGGAEGVGIQYMFTRAPLYYQLSSFTLKGFKIDKLINQFYLIRIFSFVLFLLTVYFTYLSARILFKENSLCCLAVVSFVAFLPQFLIISTSVNPINLAVFLETTLIYLMLLSLHKGKKLLVVLFGPIIIFLGFFTHRAAIFMVPPFLVLLLIYFIKSLKNKRELLKISFILFIVIMLFLAVYLVAYHLFPDPLNTVVRESAIKPRIAEINHFIEYLSAPSAKSAAFFLEGFFKSFWYFAGWMRFHYLLDIYSILKFVCLLSFLGLLKYSFSSLFLKKHKSILGFQSFLILSIACLSFIIGILIRYLPRISVAQGRYVFPAISAFAILFVLGLREIIPKKLEKWLPIFIIIGFIVLNIYTLFNSLIRVFYYFTNA